MINAVKLVILLLLTWMLFMVCNCSVTFVAAPEPTQIWPAVAAPVAPTITAAEAPTTAQDLLTTATTTTTTKTPPSTIGVDYSNTTTNADESNNSDGDGEQSPSEIQKAVCTVTAGEVRASAEAVTTKTLKGVCGSAELKLAFSDLEAKMYNELQEIKILLQQLAQKAGITSTSIPAMQNLPQLQPPPSVQPHTDATTHIIFPNNPILFAPTLQPLIENTPNRMTTVPLKSVDNEIPAVEPNVLKTPQLKSLLLEKGPRKPVAIMREQEISKFNNTMLTDRDFKVFTYYWKLENFTARIESGNSQTVESPIFSIKGKSLHIKAYFQHLHRDFLYLQLEYATLKSSNRNNIILDMGGLFKEISNEKVIFKHKISILNQQQQRFKDLVSQEFNNLETGFLIPNSALLGSPYIKNDSLLIQIFLYL